ncbi:tail fiber domain-containing protein [Bdellovibrio sp. HCB337]|uniref:tail fiber domain-containing protein n=1 Tax=Bdellovibrio sp. HCB337 TaxID=3394358 RepID=UPI0039A54913
MLALLPALTLTQTASAEFLSPMMKDFSAPIIKDRTLLPGDTPFGSIVFDNTANNFYGLSANGTWKQLGGGGGGGAGANTALSNLASTAINADLLPASDNMVNLGDTSGHQFLNIVGNCGTYGYSGAQIGDCGTDKYLTVNTDALINGITVGRGTGSGIRNAALGRTALASNTVGDYNVAVGFEALSLATDIYANVAVGAGTLRRHTSGGSNVAVGHNAMISHITGDQNVGIGWAALNNNVEGSSNVVVGSNAMSNSLRGSRNVVIGNSAFSNYNPSTDEFGFNTIVGNETGNTIGTGKYNTILGAQVTGLPEGTSNNIVLADGEGNQRIRVIDNGNTGIGTTAPSTKLQVAGVISPSIDNTYALGGSSLRFTEVYATNGTINTSDERAKKEIQNSDLGLSFIEKLRPVFYRWKNGADEKLHYGLIAQETEKAIQEAKHSSKEEAIVSRDPKSGMYGLNYSELISPVIKAIQELSLSDKSSQDEIAALKEQNADLKKRIEKLEQLVQAK